ncbi:MAG: DEDD exonuclease domain-containing protein [Propionibacteriaceae bacterium]|nr:DEDD exonuclease domain-containing protein [Propionibacteriaceae bacterium]
MVVSQVSSPVGARPPSYPDENLYQPTIDDIDTPLIDTTFCVIDLETTGTSHESRITEIGAVKVCAGEVIGEFHTLINPNVPIPAFITSLTGITNADVRSAPMLREVFASLIEFCRGCVMVAHNARFDMGFIARASTGLGYEWPASIHLDTVALARHIIPRNEVKNYRLETLARYFSTSISPTHRALDDARATVDILHAMFERVGNQGVRTLHELQHFSHTISKARRDKHSWAADLPTGPGVYYFVRDAERGRQILYVGTSKQIRKRVATYFTASESRRRMDEMVLLATGVEATPCRTALEAAIVELRLITAHQPPYNRRSKSPHHTWVKTTVEPIPRLSIVRKVCDDGAAYCGPFPGKQAAEDASLAITEAFAVRPCLDRLSVSTAREPCALAEMASCPAPCTCTNLDSYDQTIDRVKQCLNGDIREVRRRCLETIADLSEQYRYEEANDVLTRLRLFEYGMHRKARLMSLASCPQIVAARRLDQAWEIHIIRYGQLAGAQVARSGEDPYRIAETGLSAAATISPPAVEGMPGGSIEEAELIAAWMEQPGVRLLDIEGIWAWPTHCELEDLH